MTFPARVSERFNSTCRFIDSTSQQKKLDIGFEEKVESGGKVHNRSWKSWIDSWTMLRENRENFLPGLLNNFYKLKICLVIFSRTSYFLIPPRSFESLDVRKLSECGWPSPFSIESLAMLCIRHEMSTDNKLNKSANNQQSKGL